MTTSLLVKILTIYLAVSILLYAGGVRLTDAISGKAFNTLIGSNITNGTLTTENQQFTVGTISTAAPDVNQQTGILGGGITFVDVLRAIGSFVNLIINVLLAIPTLFFIFPPVIQLFVGVPLGFLAFIGLIYFVRTGI